MPYLIEDDKTRLNNGLGNVFPETPGELNYLITTLCQRYWSKSARNYSAHNAIIGALECAKQEYYRRAAVPYENEKIKSNGDVY